MENKNVERVLMAKATQVISEFDFGKVESYMRLIKWTWQSDIPSKSRMRIVSTALLEKAIVKYVETGITQPQFEGGFCVYIYVDDNGDKVVKLSFEAFRKQA